MSLLDRALAGVEQGLEGTHETVADALRTVRFLRGRAAFEPRDDDVYVVTYPRSGTTWMQFILYLLRSDRSMDFEHISEVSPWWERSMALGSRRAEDFGRLDGPRIFKSHLPRRWLPNQGRYIYITRDGLDVAVSYYHLYKSHIGFAGDFAAFFERFVRGELQYRSWFKHVEGWRRSASDPRVLLLDYESLRADLRGSVETVARFLGWPADESTLDAVEDMGSFAFMKAHESKFDPITETLLDQGLVTGRFLRQGQSGGGRDAVTEAMRVRFEAARSASQSRPDLEARLPDFLH